MTDSLMEATKQNYSTPSTNKYSKPETGVKIKFGLQEESSKAPEAKGDISAADQKAIDEAMDDEPTGQIDLAGMLDGFDDDY